MMRRACLRLYSKSTRMSPIFSGFLCGLLLALLVGFFTGPPVEAAAFATTARQAWWAKKRSRTVLGTPTEMSSSSSSSSTTSTDFEYLETVRQGVAEAGFRDEWDAAVEFLSESLMTREEAEDSLAKAWNWRGWAIVTSPIARKFIKTVEPNAEQIRTAVEWFCDGGPLAPLPDDVLAAGVRERPETYLISPDVAYDKALESAPEPYNDPKQFRETLLRSPSILGCTFNCADTGCNSECGSCWVSFQTVLKKQSSSKTDL